MDHIITCGEYVNDIYFIDHGIFRIYHIKEGAEFTTNFLFSPVIFNEQFSIEKLSPTFFNVQALSECICYKANYRDFENLIEKNSNYRKMFLKFYENIYIEGIKRQISFIYDTQTKRYNNLIKEHPEMLKELPLQYIASYIGVRPETLSRIRKKL